MIVNGKTVPEPPGNAFWVFGYGSLMWRPGFPYTSVREARLFGYRRTLCVLSHVYRGSPGCPGLVFGLDAGGSCVGRAFRVSRARSRTAYEYLMRREMVRGVYRPLWLPVRTARGPVSALCFVVDRDHHQYAPDLAERDLIECIRRARGTNGSNVEYVVNTCRQLEKLGVRSRRLNRIRDAVASPLRTRA